MEITDRLGTAYAKLTAALEQVSDDPSLAERIAEAHNLYTTALAKAAQQPIAAEVNAAFNSYRDQIVSGLSGPEKAQAITDCYQTYLDDVRAAWADNDPTTLAPAELAAIGQSLSHVAWLIEMGIHDSATEIDPAADNSSSGDQGSSLWGPTIVLSGAGQS